MVRVTHRNKFILIRNQRSSSWNGMAEFQSFRFKVVGLVGIQYNTQSMEIFLLRINLLFEPLYRIEQQRLLFYGVIRRRLNQYPCHTFLLLLYKVNGDLHVDGIVQSYDDIGEFSIAHFDMAAADGEAQFFLRFCAHFVSVLVTI